MLDPELFNNLPDFNLCIKIHISIDFPLWCHKNAPSYICAEMTNVKKKIEEEEDTLFVTCAQSYTVEAHIFYILSMKSLIFLKKHPPPRPPYRRKAASGGPRTPSHLSCSPPPPPPEIPGDELWLRGTVP